MLFEKVKLEDDEQVLLLVRRHWFVISVRILRIFLSAITPFILFSAGSLLSSTLPPETIELLEVYQSELWFIAGLWLLIHWMSIAYALTDYYLDTWLITDRRIITIDQKRLFVRHVGSFRLERLQDINIEIIGFLATLLDYGTIEAQTAGGSETEFRSRQLPHPREIKSVILEATDHRLKNLQ